jgi:uncharacterized protein (TIGR02678 family)
MTTPRVSTAGLDAGERRIAARHLLASPILTATRQPAELDLVRRHATALKAMFAAQLGYALIIESSFARLVKAPLPASAPLRPARRASDDSPFTATTYVHLSLTCAALLAPGVGEQILISALVDQIRADAAEQGITITDGIGDRRQLVAALRLLTSWGVVSETDGSLAAWGERSAEEALLSINRSLLVHLLPSPLHQFSTAEQAWASPGADDPPRRRLRRRLVENPALFRAELPEDELEVLSRDRNDVARQLDENFGLVLEVRAEGVLAYDPSGTLTDLDFPGSGSAKQAALLLLDELTAAAPGRPTAESVVLVDGAELPGSLAPWPLVDQALTSLLARYRTAWKSAYAQSMDTLRGDVVGLLAALRLAQPLNEGLAVFPFAARYQPQVRMTEAAR